MKRLSMFCMGAALAVSMLPTAASAQTGEVVIGNYDAQSGNYTLFEHKLVTTFPDGGPIQAFEVVSISNGLLLARYGQSAQLQSYADTVPILERTIAGGGPSNLVFTVQQAPFESLICRDFGCPSINGGGCRIVEGDCTCKIVLTLIDPFTREESEHVSYDDSRCGGINELEYWTWQLVILSAFWP